MVKQQTDPAPGYIQTSLMFGNVVLAEGSLQEIDILSSNSSRKITRSVRYEI
jgi:hypothetical protein